MNDNHDVSHQFLRYDSSSDCNSAMGVLIPPRKGGRKVTLSGIYPGAKVQRSVDWSWGDQDGGSGKPGKVSKIQDWDQNSRNSVASVKWSETKFENLYRVGHRGKVDVQCIQPANFWSIYIEHLPTVGKANPLSVGGGGGQKPSANIPNNAHVTTTVPNVPCYLPSKLQTTFRLGQRVKFCVDEKTLENLQNGHGGFNPKMLAFINEVGLVHRFTTTGDVRVQFPGYPESNFRWTINPQALKCITEFRAGDLVKLIEDIETVRQLQFLNGWTPHMDIAIGKVGQVVKIYPNEDVRVLFCGNEWTFHPGCLRKVASSAKNPAAMPPPYTPPVANQIVIQPPVPQNTDLSSGLIRASAKGDLITFQERLNSMPNLPIKAIRCSLQAACQNGHLDIVKVLVTQFPNDVDFKYEGKTPLQMAAHGGHVRILQYLLSDPERLSLLETRDDEGDTALHYAAYGKKTGSIEVLVDKGADINASNAKQCSVLHLAVLMKDLDTVRVLLAQPNVNVNNKDAFQDTPLHEGKFNCVLYNVSRRMANKPLFYSSHCEGIA